MKKLDRNTLMPILIKLIITASLLGSCVVAWDIISASRKQNACLHSYQLLCTKARTCAALESATECDELVKKEGYCNKELPEVDTIQQCEKEMRQITCVDALPEVCTSYM